MKRFVNILLFVIISSVASYAQNVFQPKQINTNFKGLVYKTEYSFDMKLMTQGFSIGYTSGELQTYYRTNFFQFDFAYIRDSKERKQNKNNSISNIGSSESFTFGKQNSLFILRAGKGFKKYLSEKATRKGLAVGYALEGGVSLGILKPYYLQLVYRDVEGLNEEVVIEERFSEENRDKFLDYNSIFGGSSFWKGITESTISVGAHGKAGGHFALGAYEKYVRSVELGVMFDVFLKKAPIFVETENTKNRRLFLNLYATLHLGKRK